MSELPRWKCHKIVEAAKILAISYQASPALPMGGHYLLVGDVNIKVSAGWVERHGAKVGGYFVRDDETGYEFYSPAEAFEKGYTRIEQFAQPDRVESPIIPNKVARLEVRVRALEQAVYQDNKRIAEKVDEALAMLRAPMKATGCTCLPEPEPSSDDCPIHGLMAVEELAEQIERQNGLLGRYQQRMAEIIERRVVVENALLNMANGKVPLPTPEDCRKMAIKLGTPGKHTDVKIVGEEFALAYCVEKRAELVEALARLVNCVNALAVPDWGSSHMPDALKSAEAVLAPYVEKGRK